jgi:hypothetical protein
VATQGELASIPEDDMQKPSVQDESNGHAAPQDQSTTAVHNTAAGKTRVVPNEATPPKDFVGNHDSLTTDQTNAECSNSDETETTEDLSLPNVIQPGKKIDEPQEPATATEDHAPVLATLLVTEVPTGEDEVEESAKSTASDTHSAAPMRNSQKTQLEEISNDSNSRKTTAPTGDNSASPTTQNGVTPGKHFLTVRFHRDGDMYVKVMTTDGKIVLYDVVSACLAAASPVWRRIVYGTNHARASSDHSLLEMLEDNHFALYVLFKIVHYHYYDMPKRPTVDQFHSICVVASKYDCTHLFVPYMKEWIMDLDWQVIMASDHNDDEKTLVGSPISGPLHSPSVTAS